MSLYKSKELVCFVHSYILDICSNLWHMQMIKEDFWIIQWNATQPKTKKEGNSAIWDNVGGSWGNYPEISQEEKDKYCIISFTYGIKKKSLETEIRFVVRIEGGE